MERETSKDLTRTTDSGGPTVPVRSRSASSPEKRAWGLHVCRGPAG